MTTTTTTKTTTTTTTTTTTITATTTTTAPQDFQFGLRGLGLRHVAELDFRGDDGGAIIDKDKGGGGGDAPPTAATATATNAANRVQIPFWRTLPLPALAAREQLAALSPVEVRSGLSVKRIRGVAVPQLWRMGRVRALVSVVVVVVVGCVPVPALPVLQGHDHTSIHLTEPPIQICIHYAHTRTQLDRALWGSLHAMAHGVGTTLGATFDGAQQVCVWLSLSLYVCHWEHVPCVWTAAAPRYPPQYILPPPPYRFLNQSTAHALRAVPGAPPPPPYILTPDPFPPHTNSSCASSCPRPAPSPRATAASSTACPSASPSRPSSPSARCASGAPRPTHIGLD